MNPDAATFIATANRCRAIIAALTLLAAGSLRAQEASTPLFHPPVEGPAIGLYGGIHRATVAAAYAVDARGLTQQTDCGRYESGTERGWLFGAMGELPLTHVLGVLAGVELATRDASLAYPCVDRAGIRMPDGSIAEARTEFRSDARYHLLTLHLDATIRPAAVPFVLAIGPTISLLTDAGYTAREVIVSPEEASFVSGGQERAIGSGDFATGDVSLGIGASLWYEAPIGGRWALAPRVAGAIALIDEVAGGGIRATALQATLGLVYRFPPRASVATPIEAGAEPAQ